MFPFGGSAVVPFLDHRMAGYERRCRSGHQHRVTQFSLVPSSAAGSRIDDQGHQADIGLPVDLPAAMTDVEGEAAIQTAWPPLIASTPRRMPAAQGVELTLPTRSGPSTGPNEAAQR